MGMTMKREAKANILRDFTERRTGARVERSISPRQCRIFGRTLPAGYAARYFLDIDRQTRRTTRDGWAEARAGRRVRWTNAAGRTVCKGPHHFGETDYRLTRR